MRDFFNCFMLEIKRTATKKFIIALALVFVLQIYNLQVEFDKAKELKEKEARFQTVGQKYFKKIRTYDVYSVYGIQILFQKSALDVLFNNAIVPEDVTSKIDSISSLRIINDLKGKALDPRKLGSDNGFSGTLLFLMSLMALAYGFLAYESREFQRSLSSLLTALKVFFSVSLCRLCVIALTLVLMFGVVASMAAVHETPFTSGDWAGLAVYMTAAFLNLACFFFLGVIPSFFRHKSTAVVMAFAAWFLFLITIPGFINSVVAKKLPSSTADYQAELDKFEIVSEFETRSEKEAGTFNRNKIETGRKIIENFWNNDYKKIEGVEQGLYDRISAFADYYWSLAAIMPVTFFQSTGNEVSSRGYENYLAFYKYNREMQRRFVRFYIDRCFYNDPRQIVSFIKATENIYPARTMLPRNFKKGITYGLIWVIILAAAAYYRFHKYLYAIRSTRELSGENHPIIVSKGETKFLYMHKPHGLNEKLFNLLCGRLHTGESLKLEIANQDLTENKDLQNFLYICHPDSIPNDITAGALATFILRQARVPRSQRAAVYAALETQKIRRKIFSELESEQKSKVYSLLLPYFKKDIYLLDNIGNEMPRWFLIEINDIMLHWAGAGASVIYLTTEREIKQEDFDNGNMSRDIIEKKMWPELLSHLKGMAISNQ